MGNGHYAVVESCGWYTNLVLGATCVASTLSYPSPYYRKRPNRCPERHSPAIMRVPIPIPKIRVGGSSKPFETVCLTPGRLPFRSQSLLRQTLREDRPAGESTSH